MTSDSAFKLLQDRFAHMSRIGNFWDDAGVARRMKLMNKRMREIYGDNYLGIDADHQLYVMSPNAEWCTFIGENHDAFLFATSEEILTFAILLA